MMDLMANKDFLWISVDKFLVQNASGWTNLTDPSNVSKIIPKMYARLTLLFIFQDFYLLHNGKKLDFSSTVPAGEIVHVLPRIPGGKGGFGSMLRAIGAQIEKTTNREACRDLSGRRLRDINEEKRYYNATLAFPSNTDKNLQAKKLDQQQSRA
jgi:hypothetical protein